ncbi:MAG: lamin tail domain-containing protein, partial [Opitutae bacterium]|nr:lamin tail domain-containing protein [Opitutae bacterium]
MMKRIFQWVWIFLASSSLRSEPDLFFSEYAEGSSYNKYLEIYNPTGSPIDLSGYAYPSVSNAPATPGVHEKWNTFPTGATIEAGGVYIILHTSSGDPIRLKVTSDLSTFASSSQDDP